MYTYSSDLILLMELASLLPSFSAQFAELCIALTHLKSDINALILDYLTMEGYPKAAAHFSKEANLKPQQQDSSIRTRQQIQNSIHMGKIDEAIVALNYLNPEVRFFFFMSLTVLPPRRYD